MIFRIVILVIILAIVFISTTEDNKSKVSTKRIIGYDTQTGKPIYGTNKIVGYDTQTGQPIYEKISQDKIVGYDTRTGVPLLEGEVPLKTKEVKIKKPLTEEEKTKISNSVLMIVGALLIVIASIIFLVSSWNSVPGLLKTGVLIAVQLLFLLFSYICKKKLNIVKVGEVFKYLTYAFTPVIIISLACFNIIGNYFTIDGNGFKLYLALSFLLSDILYKIIATIKKEKFTKIMSFFSEILAIIFILLHFNLEYHIILFVLSIYSFLFFLLLQGNFLDKKSYSLTYKIFSWLMLLLLTISILYDKKVLNNVSMLLFSIIFYIEYIKTKDENNKKINFILFMYSYILALLFINIVKIPLYFVYTLALIPLILLTKKIKNDNIREFSNNIILMISVVINILAIHNTDRSLYYLLTYVCGFVLYTFMFIYLEKKECKVLAYILFTFIFMDICYITFNQEFIKYIPLFIIPLIYLLEIIFDKLKDKYSDILIIVTLLLESVVLIRTYCVLIPLLYLIIYIKLEKKDEALLILPMLTSLSLFTMDKNIITTILSYCLVGIYTIMSLLKKKVNYYTYISLASIILASVIFKFDNFITFGIGLLWSIVHWIRNYKDSNRLYKIVGILSILGLYLSTLNHFNVEYISVYLLGWYLAVMIITSYVFKNIHKDVEFFEYFGFIIISAIGLYIISDLSDEIIYIMILFVLTIMSFSKKWHSYFYCSLAVMVLSIILVSLEYLKVIPWYIYILLIGLALILFAMFDEKKKINKNIDNKIEQLDENILPNYSKQEEPIEEIEKVTEVPDKEIVLEKRGRKRVIKDVEEVSKEDNQPKRRGRKKKSETIEENNIKSNNEK